MSNDQSGRPPGWPASPGPQAYGPGKTVPGPAFDAGGTAPAVNPFMGGAPAPAPPAAGARAVPPTIVDSSPDANAGGLASSPYRPPQAPYQPMPPSPYGAAPPGPNPYGNPYGAMAAAPARAPRGGGASFIVIGVVAFLVIGGGVSFLALRQSGAEDSDKPIPTDPVPATAPDPTPPPSTDPTSPPTDPTTPPPAVTTPSVPHRNVPHKPSTRPIHVTPHH